MSTDTARDCDDHALFVHERRARIRADRRRTTRSSARGRSAAQCRGACPRSRELIALDRALVPPACVACRAPLGARVVAAVPGCTRALPWLPGGLPALRAAVASRARGCPAAAAAFARAWAPLAYEGVARDARRRAEVPRRAAGGRADGGAHGGEPAGRRCARADAALVPVPPQPARRRRRGFDPGGGRSPRALAPRLELPLGACLRAARPRGRQVGAVAGAAPRARAGWRSSCAGAAAGRAARRRRPHDRRDARRLRPRARAGGPRSWPRSPTRGRCERRYAKIDSRLSALVRPTRETPKEWGGGGGGVAIGAEGGRTGADLGRAREVVENFARTFVGLTETCGQELARRRRRGRERAADSSAMTAASISLATLARTLDPAVAEGVGEHRTGGLGVHRAEVDEVDRAAEAQFVAHDACRASAIGWRTTAHFLRAGRADQARSCSRPMVGAIRVGLEGTIHKTSTPTRGSHAIEVKGRTFRSPTRCGSTSRGVSTRWASRSRAGGARARGGGREVPGDRSTAEAVLRLKGTTLRAKEASKDASRRSTWSATTWRARSSAIAISGAAGVRRAPRWRTRATARSWPEGTILNRRSPTRETRPGSAPPPGR